MRQLATTDGKSRRGFMRERAKPQPPSAGQLADLTEAVRTLTDQVRCMRLAIDEIESELDWAIRTKVLDRLPPPEFPCDARLSLHSPADEASEFEHVGDRQDLPGENSA